MKSAPRAARLTARGAATRARILEAAANLMHIKGINATTLDDVRAASGTSKSQLYQHFADKDALVCAVAGLWAQRVLDREQQHLERLSSFSGLQRWRNVLVQLNGAQNGAHGCALGSMANEIADHDEEARAILAATFASWQKLIADGLRRMQDNGTLKPDADPDQIATGLMAALQGGYLLAQTTRDVKPMEVALDMALSNIKSQLVG
ncbi:TetR/AcrR family transcriptional regulator [Actinomadura sp. DC4]|uniref:TetR/AcrR family transcriptional regulator n=1 Tax=Actinomadura sp. DC4 TaxID=3055069 RepID=UPI0025B13BE1|nr:TetR/AcrR family transcriptional regulator [Actinomadura sp. DC4]MDN3355824.1 TetR family transcriptional regulator C-terminal domain-containing protein [Actinomadura sp. DC4]